MQEKEWTRAFGRCNSWSTQARKSRRGNDHARGKPSQEEHAATQAGRPKPVGPSRSAQAGRPPLHKEPPGSRLLQASFPLLPQFVCSSLCAQNHRRHSQPSQA
jgi:hypothetical protein